MLFLMSFLLSLLHFVYFFSFLQTVDVIAHGYFHLKNHRKRKCNKSPEGSSSKLFINTHTRAII